MAITQLGADSARNNPFSIFATFDRATLASAVEVLLAVLDTLDGDPDNEDDDPAGQADEDELNYHSNNLWGGDGCAGCLISDPDSAVDDRPCDDIDQDLEDEETRVAHYGIDQTHGMLPPFGILF